MERIPTKLIVEGGQVRITDKPMPAGISLDGVTTLTQVKTLYDLHNEALESWKKEAYPVGNTDNVVESPDEVCDLVFSMVGLKFPIADGIYDCPDGLVFEVKEYCGCHLLTGPSDECIAAGGTNPYKCVKERNKVAILSFKEPGKEQQKQLLV